MRRRITHLGTSLLMTVSVTVAQPALQAAAGAIANAAERPTILVDVPETLIAQGVLTQGSLDREPEGVSRTVPPWRVAVILIGAASVAFTWLYLQERQRRWQRVDLARQQAMAFRERKAVRNVLQILDYEEYRIFQTAYPKTGELISFEAHDGRLKRALRSHDQMTKTRQGLDEILQLAQTHPVDAKTQAVFEAYEKEEFFIEVTLRDWFDEFLEGLESFDALIESGLVSTAELKPFIIYWIQIIGDRSFRRKGGSGFYDQLFHYIYWSGYSGVQSLFERYGFKILPPPYSTHDFKAIDQEERFDTLRAICLAKAAYLVYEDREYVNDIVRLWLSADPDDRWKRMSPREYVVDLIKHWRKEQDENNEFDIRENFKYLDMALTDTQAFLFRQGDDVVLVFRGSQQLNDWKTNFKIRLQAFTILADQKATPPKGRVHRGFSEAWQSVEKIVVYYLKKWWTPQTKLWITGHSLGGALAAVATISLESQGFKVSGLYTFGQPRVADWTLVRYMNNIMGDRIFRYANNNDIVPLIPPQFIPWMPLRLYGHMGKFRYFSFRGALKRHSFMGQRLPDRLLGYLSAIGKPGIDAIDDHKMEFYLANLQTALKQEEELLRIETERQRQTQDVSQFIDDFKA